ncbi:MAG: FAD/NAD(P)-binding protein [Desulfocapsaceae bacterium]
MSYRFAIIGGGLTATSMLCQLVEELELMGDEGRRLGPLLAIDIFEKHAVLGPGLPHNADYVLPFHITNMCAKDMTARISRPNDFQEWVERNQGVMFQRFDYQNVDFSAAEGGDESCAHYPREVMGEYLKRQIDEAAAKAKDLSIKIDIWTNCEVVDLWPEESGYYLTAKENTTVRNTAGPFDGVLLATGHWFESNLQENYFSSPWPASKLLAAIPPGAEVGVIGSSLSAVETALTLTSEGQFCRSAFGRLSYVKPDVPRKLTLFSRQGLLPRVRGRIGSRQNRYFTCERLRRLMDDRPNQLTLSELFHLLDHELSAAYENTIDWQQIVEPGGTPAQILEQDINRALKGDGIEGELIWQTVLVQIFPVVRELYLSLSASERQRFDRDFTTLFFAHAATQPAINAEKLLALMEGGIVEVVKLRRDYRFTCNESTGGFEVHYTGPDGNELCNTFPYCVDARGQPRSVETDSSELTRRMLKRRLIQLEEMPQGRSDSNIGNKTGSILIDPTTHRVKPPVTGRAERPNLDLFAVGAMTRGQIIDSSMAYGLARSTETIVTSIVQRLRQSF